MSWLTRLGRPVAWSIRHQTVRAWAKAMDLPADAKQRLRDMTPGSYTGLAERLARGI